MLKFCGGFFLASAIVAGASEARSADKAVAVNYPPLMIEGDVENPGFAIEVLQEAARRAGREIDLTFLPFERALFTVRNDPATLMPALFRGKNREDLVRWVAEIQRGTLRFASVSGQVDDLETARALPSIGLESGTMGDIWLTNQGFENLVRVTAPESSARMLASGRIRAWLITEPLGRRIWNRLELPQRLAFGAIVHEVPVYLAASPGLPDNIARDYEAAIRSMRADGTLDEILSRYNSE